MKLSQRAVKLMDWKNEAIVGTIGLSLCGSQRIWRGREYRTKKAAKIDVAGEQPYSMPKFKTAPSRSIPMTGL
jgi:hypothetical protein